MRPRLHLGALQRPAMRKLLGIRDKLGGHAIPPSRVEAREMALCIIEAQNTWGMFVRFFFVSCMLGAKTLGGARVKQSVGPMASEADAVAFARRILPGPLATGPLSEPQWHSGKVLLRLAAAARLSNESQIQVAYSVVGRALEDLPKARNFFAHRSKHSARILEALRSQYALPKGTRPGLIPAQRHPSEPYSIARAWCEELIHRMRLLPF